MATDDDANDVASLSRPVMPAARKNGVSRYLPGWVRFILGLWLVCLLLLGFQQLSLLVFSLATTG